MIDGLTAQSGGSMRLVSQVGKGTTVEVWLPRSQKTRSVSPPTSDEMLEGGSSSYTILVVDDDLMIAEVTAALLEDLNHTVVIANSGSEALEHLRALGDAIDLLLTDHAMPGMTGIELAARVREKRSDFPIILASGYAEIPSGEDLGLFRLAKPYRREDLEAGVIAAMNKGARHSSPDGSINLPHEPSAGVRSRAAS
jgi:CheY-like chemotaxis protein